MTFKSPWGDVPLIRIGCGAGFSGDRWDAAVPVVRTLRAAGGPAVLMFETLAERTLALAQVKRRHESDSGWEPTLERFVSPVLRDCVDAGIPIVGNFGAANPQGAAHRLQKLARALGLPPLRIAVVHGDDLLTTLPPNSLDRLLPTALRGRSLASANAYLGAQEIAQALSAGAQIVVTGRVADPALALGPLLAHFGWAMDDWDRLACGTMAGHLLECGAQVCGGYFADPGFKDVPNLSNVGFPIVEVDADGGIVVTKADGTGGCVDRRTVTEQLLYEIHDPAAYFTPDVVADISDAWLADDGTNRVRVSGIRGHERPSTLKATVCYEGGWLAECEISYAGPNAEARARLAARIVCERMQFHNLGTLPLRADLIGVSSVFADDASRWRDEIPSAVGCTNHQDVRLRIAAAPESREAADILAREVLSLYTCGPAGGGGVRTHITPRLASDSCFVPREWLQPNWSFVE
jgi:limonene-1,2-epoxide hydrolase